MIDEFAILVTDSLQDVINLLIDVVYRIDSLFLCDSLCRIEHWNGLFRMLEICTQTLQRLPTLIKAKRPREVWDAFVNVFSGNALLLALVAILVGDGLFGHDVKIDRSHGGGQCSGRP